MSFFSDAIDFELFHGKDILKRLEDDPKRLILGVDPASTFLWNKILGRDDEPIVNQLGGAMGSGSLGLGDGGGVFDRAEAQGIDTGAGQSMQNIAEVIASFYGAQGLGGIGGENPGASGILDPSNLQQAGGLLGNDQPIDNTVHNQAVLNEQRKRKMARRGLF